MFLFYDRQDFYKRMLEIQAKLRKSEEERIRLEERFKLLVQESRNRHDACINRLRLRYIEFLEEQRDRDERNNKLQGALDKVDSRLALMISKSDRLNALRKNYEAYLLHAYGTRSCGSVTGDSGVTSQHEERSFRKDMMTHSRRHSIQSVSIPPSTPTTNFSRVVTPNLSKHSELRFIDPPRTYQSELSYSHQLPIYSTPKVSYNSNPKISTFTPQIPEIRVSPTFSPTLVSKDVQTDKPINSFFDQSFGSVDPYQISGIGRISQSSTQTLPQFPSQLPNQFSNQYSQVTRNPQIDVSQYLYTPSLPKTADLGSRTDFRGLSDLENTSRVFRNTSPTPSYPDYSWRYPRSTKFEEKSPKFERSSIFERNSIFDKSPIYEKTSIFDKNSIYERNSRFEDKNPPRFFRRFDFNTTFRRNDRPLPSSRDILSSTRSKPSLKPCRLSTSLNSDYDVNERSRRMDNELDRYIGKIRNLHRDMDLQSLEDLDHEQNTSGDLLNVTLSDDDIDLPGEERSREKRSSKKGEMPEVSGKQFENDESASRVPNTDPVTQTDAPVPETRREVSSVESDETSAVISVDGINSEIAKGVKIATKFNANDGPLDEKNRVFDDSKTSIFGELVSGTDNFTEVEIKSLKETAEEEQKPTHVVDQTMEADEKTDDKENIVNETAEAENREQSVDGESKEEKVLEGSQDEKKAEEEKKEGQGEEGEEGYKENEYVQDANQEYQYSSNQGYSYDPNAGYEQYPAYSNEVYDQYNQQYDPNQQYNQDPSQYVEGTVQYSADPNQQYDPNLQYDPSQYVQDPNQQYVQDPNQQYEQDPSQYVQDAGQSYEQDTSQYAQDSSQQYAQDPSQQYAQDPTQQYTQDPSQEYVQDASQEYVQGPTQEYVSDPTQEYVPDSTQEYVPDSTQEYVPDPTQEYVQDPRQEFVDSNQQYAQDPGQYVPTQEYQDPNVQYDPNQANDYSSSQGYSEKDQTHNSDQNYTPEAVVETDKVEVKAEEKETVEATSIKKKEVNLESDTESTIERNASNTESDFDFN